MGAEARFDLFGFSGTTEVAPFFSAPRNTSFPLAGTAQENYSNWTQVTNTRVKLPSVFLAALLMLPGSLLAQESAPPASNGFPHGLAPGDQLNVRLYDFPDLGGALLLRVSTDGTLHLPYAGTVQVRGFSPSQAESAIVESLRNKGIVKEPNVTIDVVSAVNSNVTVLGQVAAPKSIPLFAPVPVSYVLSQVGGITGLAAHHLSIIHPSSEPPTTVDYDPDAPNTVAMNTLVAPGDIVNVSSRGVYFVAGEVNRPGIYPLGGALSVGQVSTSSGENVVKNITLLEALAQAGGITAIAARSRMTILRVVDGKREQITVDEVKLYKGLVADPILHADDIIYIPTSYIRQQTNNLFSTALSSLYAAVQIREINQ